MKIIIHLPALLAVMSSCPVLSLEALSSEDMDAVHGQGGVYLSGEFAVNQNGGPLWSLQNGQTDEFGITQEVRNCGSAENPENCGMRIAVKVEEGTDDGWIVLDDITGSFAFEGLTLRTRTVTSGSTSKEVVEVGLPNEIRTRDFGFTLAFSSSGEWVEGADKALFSVYQDGNISLSGNLLMFPVDVQ